VTAPHARSAAAALDQARPVLARLDIQQHPEELAADLIEAWNLTQTALRSLIGSTALTGQALIRELRQRELLSLDQAHALVEFNAAHDRAQRTEYRPTSGDVAAARTGFQQLEAALVSSGSSAPVSAAPPMMPPTPPDLIAPPPSPLPSPGSSKSAVLTVSLIVVVLLGAALGLGYYLSQVKSGASAMERGRVAYAAGDRTGARNAFAEALRQNDKLSEAHVYLGRIAREEGDAQTAGRELTRAVELAPNSALAQREMGAHLLAQGNYDLARNFYRRAVELDPTDKNAMGFLGCTLIRLGQFDVGLRFIQRAGQGSWSACVPPPGAIPGPVPGPAPAPIPR
jgi:tetratricopeptide (TPR) repeat protein